jgi:hypothetical protein
MTQNKSSAGCDENSPLFVKAILEELESKRPVAAKLIRPRRYYVPGGYASPRTASFFLHSVLLELEKLQGDDAMVFNENDALTGTLRLGTALLIRNGVPTYFVSREIMRSVLNTDPPENFQGSEIVWPVESMLLMLPEGLLKTPSGGDCNFLVVGRIPPNEPIEIPSLSIACNLNAEKGCGSVFCFTGSVNEPGFPTYATWIPESNVIDWEMNSANWDPTILDEKGVKYDGSVHDGEFAAFCLAVAINIILFMNAGPELVEKETLGTAKRNRKPGIAPEDQMWNPNFFGKHYVIQHEHTGESVGGTVRPHLRRGHWRSQPFGPNSSLRKRIRIDCVWVNKAQIGKAP